MTPAVNWTLADLDLQAIAIAGGQNPLEYDLTGDELVNFADRQFWVDTLKRTWIGDANLDGEFTSSDMVQVFVSGKYETNANAGWEDGDWNADLKFGSSDMVAAFVAGGWLRAGQASAGRHQRRARTAQHHAGPAGAGRAAGPDVPSLGNAPS